MLMQHGDSCQNNTAVRRLIHYPLCPYSRFIRLVMYEKSLDFSLIKEEFWLERDSFIALNPSGQLPVLVDIDNKSVICDVLPIFEYLEETTPLDTSLLPQSPLERAEVRRLLGWFHGKFYREVSNALLTERVWKRMTRQEYPDSTIIRSAISLLPEHILYIANLLRGRDWLVGNRMSAADLAAASHISVVDFLGNITWKYQNQSDAFDCVREWYARIKSRPSFRALTTDVVQGFTPPLHYANPDF
jgi:glutathione S-transferase